MPEHLTSISPQLESTIILLGAGNNAIPQQFYFATDTNTYYYGNMDGSVTLLTKGPYPINTVDNFAAFLPKNFLYTTSAGALKSAPLLKVPVTTLTGASSPTADQTVILCSRSGSDYTITLGTTSAFQNKLFFFKRIDATGGSITLDPTGSVQINGSTTLALGNGDSAIVYFDGTQYHRLAR